MATDKIDAGTEPPAWPSSEDPKHVGFRRQERVRWLAPGTLLRTGFQAFVAHKFVELLDRRELQENADSAIIDLTGPEGEAAWEELWIDYVADTGDGFDATATVASQLARESITLDVGDGETVETRAGDLLVLGGDQVYPTPEHRGYENRFIGPFRAMLPWTRKPRRMVALPGNHDWYDGLTSFLRTFCQREPGRWIGGWKTQQTRSYWAVKLPQGWWLWGIDIQLGTLIDAPQLHYFKNVPLADDDKIILCWAKPTWTAATDEAQSESYAVLEYFERTVIQGRHRVRLNLAGDTHHYARYQPEKPELAQKITAGGGGAYLSATHHLRQPLHLPPGADPAEQERFELASTYPAVPDSRALTPKVLGLIYGNKSFPAIPAVLYALLAVPVNWLVGTLSQPDPRWWPPTVACLAVALLLYSGLHAFAKFSSLPSRRQSMPAAVLHVGLHAVVITLLVLLGRNLDWGLAGSPFGAGMVAGLAGAAIGPLVVGVYLYCAQFLRVNVNELFSAMGIQDHKCFVRIHVTPDGDLLIYPIKIARVPTWTFVPPSTNPGHQIEGDTMKRWYAPSHEPQAELIEPPIRVPKVPVGP